MVQNASNSWMIALQMLISLQSFTNTAVGRALGVLDGAVLIALPWVIGIPFFVAHLVQALKDPESTYRTPFFADQTETYLTHISIITALTLMILLLLTAIWVGALLLRLRLSQRHLVSVSWVVHAQLASRILFFSYYSLSVIAILALTIDYNTFEPVKQIVFATSGLAAAVVFLFETQNARLVSRLWRRLMGWQTQLHSHSHSHSHTEDEHRLTGVGGAQKHTHDTHAIEFAGVREYARDLDEDENESEEGIRVAHSIR